MINEVEQFLRKYGPEAHFCDSGRFLIGDVLQHSTLKTAVRTSAVNVCLWLFDSSIDEAGSKTRLR